MGKSTKTEIKTFLMNPTHRFTTTMTQHVNTSDVLSKSKAPRTHTLGYQKEAAVQKAEQAGEMQMSALFNQLENGGGITPIVAVHHILFTSLFGIHGLTYSDPPLPLKLTLQSIVLDILNSKMLVLRTMSGRP